MITQFNPLRFIKDQIVVVSYMGWHKLTVRNTMVKYGFEKPITIFYDISQFTDPDALVADYRCNPLFWPVYKSFDQIPNYIHVSDCQNTPTFSHWGAERVARGQYDKDIFKPLTVETVLSRFEYFRECNPFINWQAINKNL